MTTHRCPNLDEFKLILKKHSLKATPQRLAVHEAMMSLGHACADMVTQEIKEKSSAKVTVASVYNILTHMAMLGVYNYRMSANFKHLSCITVAPKFTAVQNCCAISGATKANSSKIRQLNELPRGPSAVVLVVTIEEPLPNRIEDLFHSVHGSLSQLGSSL